MYCIPPIACDAMFAIARSMPANSSARFGIKWLFSDEELDEARNGYRCNPGKHARS